ncbi:MAG TPA: hypothetical protein VF334_18820 [Polyangia bacterium]
MSTTATPRLYLDDSYLRELDSEVVACGDGWCRLGTTAFHRALAAGDVVHGVLDWTQRYAVMRHPAICRSTPASSAKTSIAAAPSSSAP